MGLTRVLRRGIVTVMMVACGGALAQERLDPAEFLALVQGKTVQFHDYPSGALVGVERFLSPRLSIWRQEGMGCTEGQITVQNGQLCFLYAEFRDTPACWYVFRIDGRLFVREVSSFSRDIQSIGKISEDPIDCPETPIG